jgi:hypothetical protein
MNKLKSYQVKLLFIEEFHRMMTFWLMGKTTTIAWRIKRMDMLWACVIDYVTIGMLPYETLYEQKCQSLS